MQPISVACSYNHKVAFLILDSYLRDVVDTDSAETRLIMNSINMESQGVVARLSLQ